MTDSTDSSAQSAHKRRMQPSRKVFDVTRPGRAPVSATSRPVIVSNKPEVQDPMMNARPQHVVADAANALHVPDEPLLMAHNPDDNEAPSTSVAVPTMRTESAASVSMPATSSAAPNTATAPAVPGNPEIEGLTDRNSALDEKAEEELAALAVEEVAKIDDASIPETSTTPSAPPLPNTQLGEGKSLEPETPQATAVPATPQPVAPDQAAAPSTPLVTEPSVESETPETNEELPDMNEIGHVPNSSVSGKPTVTPPKSSAAKGRSHVGVWVTTLVVLLVLAAVVVDVLLDGGFIVIKGIPHTHFF